MIDLRIGKISDIPGLNLRMGDSTRCLSTCSSRMTETYFSAGASFSSLSSQRAMRALLTHKSL